MVLIITHKTDFTADFVIDKLNQRKIEYKRFNCEDILDYDCSLQFGKQFSYSILGSSSFNSVWFRRTQFPNITGLTPSEKLYILNEIDSLTNNLFSVIGSKWISDPFAVYKAENKLLQLKCAQAVGFHIPDTLVTNSKEELRSFYSNFNREVIIKPISATKIEHKESPNFIFTNKLTDEIINNLEGFDLTPCIFQREIMKDYELRITVIGKKVFAASVDSQSHNETKVDWRRKRLSFKKVDIPESLKELCINLTKELGLFFGAIDLIKDKQGNYVFLEINPNGQWAWIETETKMAISDSIISELTYT